MRWHHVIGGLFGASKSAPPAELPDDDLELSMVEVAAYARALAAKRGYPDDSHDMIARRIVFLERRGIPGLGPFHRDLVLFADEPFSMRFNMVRPDGRRGGQCPIIAGVTLDPQLEAMTCRTESDAAWFPAPSNSVLLIPKLAEWLRPIGRAAVIHWLADGQRVGQAFVDGFRIALHGKIEAIHEAPYVGISGFAEDGEPKPAFRSGFTERMRIKQRHMTMMIEYLGREP